MGKHLKITAALAALCVGAPAFADTVTYDLSTLAQWTTPAAPTSGSATVVLTDVGTGMVKVTLTTNLTGTQTLTGLWFQTPGLTAVAIGSPAPSGPATPTLSYSASASAPQGDVNATGKYDLKLSFPNNAGGHLQGTAIETFYLTATGLSTASFLPAVQAANGLPSPDFYAMMGVTNAAGSGNGLGFWGATTPVPLPAALPLLVAGLSGLGCLARRRR